MTRRQDVGTASPLPSRRKSRLGRRILQIRLRKKEDDLEIGTRHFPHQEFYVGDIEESNQKFTSILEQLGQTVKEYGVDLKQAGYIPNTELASLQEEGIIAYNNLFSSSEVRNYLKDIETEAQQQNRGLSFNFTFPKNLSLFWEMLYSGGREIDAKNFWGFRHSLGRTYWEIKDYDCIEFHTGIFAAIHEKLNSSRQEIETLIHLVEQTCQRQRWELKVHFADSLIGAESISTGALLTLFQEQDFRYGIVHFACHCLNALPGEASQSFLYLSIHDKDLKLRLRDLKRHADDGFKFHPFVFLNACDSGTSGHPLQAVSFPTGILGFGAGGVIATACTIPDNFASAFASEFYRRLLEKLEKNLPVQVAEVLLETRLHFWQEYSNPLGLAYGLYAVSNQQLELMGELVDNG